MRRAFYTILVGLAILCKVDAALSAEPSLADYTGIPLFLAERIDPNIMIMLDNSDSMNYNAYGSKVGNDGTVPEQYGCGSVNAYVARSSDDAAERVSNGNMNLKSSELNFGKDDSGKKMLVGLRFDNIQINKDETITNAFIRVRANQTIANQGVYVVRGQAHDNPGSFSTSSSNISKRSITAASVTWDTTMDTWAADNNYKILNLTSIVQELVNRSGWVKGNAMVFIIARTSVDGKNDCYSFDGGFAPLLHIEYASASCPKYYGMWDPDSRYSYTNAGGGYFKKDAAGDWDGNFLNYICSRRIDVLKKVLVGGWAETRDGSGTTIIKNNNDGFGWYQWYTGNDVSPYHGTYRYKLDKNKIYMDNGDTYNVRVRKKQTEDPNDFVDGNVAGVLQKIGDKAKWGNTWFVGTEAGQVAKPIGTPLNGPGGLVADLESVTCATRTPLSETEYIMVQYFKQQDPEIYGAGRILEKNCTNDPLCDEKNGNAKIECGKNFILILTDGMSVNDGNIPKKYRDYDKDGDADDQITNGNSTSLDDMAYYARMQDLRADIPGSQNIYTYTIFAFGGDADARQLLMDTARNGAFNDKNDNNQVDGDYSDPPDQRKEWDEDGDGVPDAYYEASDGYALERRLIEAITAMVKQASSGTAASVISNTGDGEGSVVQAFFFPEKLNGLEKANWRGYLQSLWIDADGRLREDTNQNMILDESNDFFIKFSTDITGETRIDRIDPSNPSNVDNPAIENLKPIWEAGKKLSTRASRGYARKVYTTLDGHTLIEFSLANKDRLKPYLGVKDGSVWGYLGASHEERVENLIKYILGQDFTNLRNRTLAGVTWPLGDIIHSSPVTISNRGIENWDISYSDITYENFYTTSLIQGRETMVYAGANDGMLHAFTSWKYDKGLKGYIKPTAANLKEEIGDEIWAFIPRALLPHLKFLADQSYTHVYYVDQEPRVTDVKLPVGDWPSPTNHPDGWGTILIGGLGYGGRQIEVINEDFGSGVTPNNFFWPSYFCFDITDPRNPVLMWEKECHDYNGDQGFSYSKIITPKVRDQWYGIITSGPTSYVGKSSQNGMIHVIDLKDGSHKKTFTLGETKSFPTWPIAIDYALNYSVDAIYVGTMNENVSGGGFGGSVYKIQIPLPASTDYDNLCEAKVKGKCPVPQYDTNPDNWDFVKLFDAGKPIQAPLTMGIDDNYAVWLFGGTGRFLEEADKSTTNQNYFFGIKDPFFNPEHENSPPGKIPDGYYRNIGSYHAPLTTSGLMDVTGVSIKYQTDILSWESLQDQMLAKDGWTVDMLYTGERSLTQPAVIIDKDNLFAFFLSFQPSLNACKSSGESYLYGVYGPTGTANILYNLLDNTVSQGQTVPIRLDGDFIGPPPPKVGVHMGENIKLLPQFGDGRISEVPTDIEIRNSIIYWKPIICN